VGVIENGRFKSVLRVDDVSTHLARARGGGVWICERNKLFKNQPDGQILDCGVFSLGLPSSAAAGPKVLFEDRQGSLWIDTVHTHGTGCTLSAAIVAGLARGDEPHAAVDRAVRYVSRAIEAAPGLGSGHGPVNHFVDPD
jgi:hypothetical protein